MQIHSMPQTLAEKILSRAARKASVHPGEIVTCQVDLAMIHDSGGPRRVGPILRRLGVPVWDPERVVVITDHYVPTFDADSKQILALTREWVRAQGISRFHDQQGICHVVLPEQGHLQPGTLVVGGDSHSPTGGAFGCYMFGVGATEMAGVLATGEIWIRVPETIRLEWRGAFAPGVVAKDVMLFLCGKLGMDGGRYQAVEYAGEAIGAFSMQERMTLSNMTAELGGQAGLVAPDEQTAAWLRERGADPGDWSKWQSDPDAAVAEHHVFDASQLTPQVAAPHSPANSAAVEKFASVVPDVLYLGACTGAKLEDLRAAARLLQNRKIRTGLEFWVAPASVKDREQAKQEGTLSLLEEAGAKLLPSACGLCAGYGPQRLGPGQVCLSSTARNFKGRMGDPSAQVYLASPLTLAATALAGRIADPREFLKDVA